MRQRRVLCIDDDPETLNVRKLLLETFGFEVTTAATPIEGLRFFRTHNVDAVVLDYEMPQMTGGEVARKMKKMRAAVPIIILSALPWLPAAAPHECIDAFITKGGPTIALMQQLEQLIEQGAPLSPAKARLRAARAAGAVMGAVAATVRGLAKPRAAASTQLAKQAALPNFGFGGRNK